MPLVEEAISVSAQPDAIYPIVADIEKFPEFMEGVKDVRIHERGDNWTVSEWINEVEGRKIVWTERDTQDPDNWRIDFELVKGDLKRYYGYWQLAPEQAGRTTVNFSIYFEFGIPMLAGLLHPILARKLRENMRQMLDALKLQVEGAGG